MLGWVDLDVTMAPNVSAEVGFATETTIVEIIQTNKIVITAPLDLEAL